MRDSVYQSIQDASATTGLSETYLKRGIVDKKVPYIKNGTRYLINVPMLLEKLQQELEGGNE